MNLKKNWLRYTLVGAMAAGALGVANLTPANATTDVSLAMRQHDSDWRHSHPNWNGHYYWHNHHYYYDNAYRHPAVVDNEWGTIGAGVTLNADPYVSFSGSYGSWYPTASLNVDLGSTDRTRHARALYFQKPNYWRDGVRSDRVTSTRGGKTYYRFARHKY